MATGSRARAIIFSAVGLGFDFGFPSGINGKITNTKNVQSPYIDVLDEEIHPTRFGHNRKQFTFSTGLCFFRRGHLLDVFRQCEAPTVDSRQNPPWRQQTRSGFSRAVPRVLT